MRFVPLCLSTTFALFSVACGSAEDPAQPTPASEVGPGETGSAETSVDAPVDTFVPHTPKAPRCVPGDAGPEMDSAAPDVAPEVSDSASADADDAATDGSTDDGGAPTVFSPVQATSSGGPVLHHPRVVPITFDGDTNRDDVEDFVASVGCTPYWRAIGEEYGVHELVSGTPIHVADKPPATITSAGIEKWLRTQIQAKAPGWELPTPETIYAIYYPAETVVKLGTSQSCSSFGGFHKSFALADGTDVAYAVIMDCQGTVDGVTGSSSHEFIEAATDPFPFTNPAYETADIDHLVYWYRQGGEVGDLCEFAQNGGLFLPTGYPFVVQRSWSNVAARGMHDPCVPATAPVYYNVYFDQPDVVTLDGAETKGIRLAVGESKTILLHLFSDGPIDPWTVSAKDASFGEPAHLTFSFDKTTGGNGDTIALTITKKSESTTLGAEPFSISSSNGKKRNTAYGVVGH